MGPSFENKGRAELARIAGLDKRRAAFGVDREPGQNPDLRTQGWHDLSCADWPLLSGTSDVSHPRGCHHVTRGRHGGVNREQEAALRGIQRRRGRGSLRRCFRDDLVVSESRHRNPNRNRGSTATPIASPGKPRARASSIESAGSSEDPSALNCLPEPKPPPTTRQLPRRGSDSRGRIATAPLAPSLERGDSRLQKSIPLP